MLRGDDNGGRVLDFEAGFKNGRHVVRVRVHGGLLVVHGVRIAG